MEVVNKDSINRDIIENSYYVIQYFQTYGKEVTNLKLQKLMYFLEAFYMVCNPDEIELFDTSFYAWEYGPVSKILYEKYRSFNNASIELSEDEKEIGRNLPEENKRYVFFLYVAFSEYKASDLVNLTHVPGSPWHKVYEPKEEDDIINIDKEINKIETRDWFKEFLKVDETE